MVGGIRPQPFHGCHCHGGVASLRVDAPSLPAQPQDVPFSYNPQDRRVMEPGSKVIPKVVIGSKNNPETEKASLNRELEPLDGKYVYSADDPRQNTAVAFASVANAINVFIDVFGDFKWSFQYDKLAVNPNGGKDFNAFYARKNGTVNFFAEDDPIFGRPVHSGASGEIVVHETGHALLDAIRPEYFGAFRSDVGAFHESFGDMLALHTSLMDERVIKRVLVQTGGDLTRPNIAAHMAEELAQGLNNKKGANSTGGDYLRNANNQFTWSEPKSLPEKGGPEQLGWEIHSFSRLWTGAHYDLLNNMVKERIQAGDRPDVALRQSNQELLTMLARLLKESPRGDFTFKDMAVAFVKSDKIHGEGNRAALIQKVFTERKILPADLPAEQLEVPPQRSGAALFQSTEGPLVRQLGVTLGDDFGMFSGARVEIPVAAERALFKSQEIEGETQEEIRRLIAAGKIRYNDPAYQMKFPQDYFNPQGDPYIGSVAWEGDRMKIERLAIAH
ncbi:hypothetical protein IV102_10485 [bacterium]|nr:hypothetical protein [bacterium]